MMVEEPYNARIVALANNLIANKYAYVYIISASNKLILHIKNNENYNDLDDDDKYNIMLYLQQYYKALTMIHWFSYYNILIYLKNYNNLSKKLYII